MRRQRPVPFGRGLIAFPDGTSSIDKSSTAEIQPIYIDTVFWIIFVIILLAAITAILLLRLRIRAEIDQANRLIFVGLGQSGSYIDLRNRMGTLKIAGFTVRTFSLRSDREKPEVETEEPPAPAEDKKPVKKGKRLDFRHIWDMVKIAPIVIAELFGYLWSLLKRCSLETLEGEVTAGFDQPDLTGQAFGYYQAVIGAFPAVAGHFRFDPIWTEAHFAGAFRVSVALPLYHLVFQTIRLAVRLPIKLPIRRIVKLFIGMRKGDTDVQ